MELPQLKKKIKLHYHSRVVYHPSTYLLTGATLKKVDPNESSSAAPSDGRSALLDAIRKGAELKHVSLNLLVTVKR